MLFQESKGILSSIEGFFQNKLFMADRVAVFFVKTYGDVVLHGETNDQITTREKGLTNACFNNMNTVNLKILHNYEET